MRWPQWLYRLVPYLGRHQAEEDLQEELRLHLELERERQRDAGVSEDEALRAARRTLGNATLIRERTRDVWGWRWLDDLGRDVRHAVRGLGGSPGFAATVVLALALGIGANVAMFSVVHGMLIRPLPYPDAGDIVRITEAMGPRMAPFVTSASMAALLDEAESFEQLAGYGPSSFSWRGPEGAVTLRAARVSPSMFPLLRTTPHLGRLFTEEEARAGADRVVLLSHGAWTRHFGSDPDIVGSAIALNNAPHTVIGVLAEGFFFPSPEEEIWTPYVMPGYSITPPEGGWGASLRGASFSVSFVTALGRLRPGVSTERATTEVRTILQRSGLTAQAAAMGARVNALPEVDARVVSLQEELVSGYRPALLALTVATALVLLIACINVAGLLLARGITRRRALAVCAALGAGRGRLVRQLLTESVTLSTGGGVLGLTAAAVVLRGLPSVVPGDVARLDDIGINAAGLAFALALSVVVGLGFGAAPAFQWSRLSLVGALNEGSAQAAGGFRLLGSNRARAALAAAQVALAVVLLVRGRPSPAQLRGARHRRSRLRPRRGHHRAHPESRRAPGRTRTGAGGPGRRGRRPFPGGDPGGHDAPGASAGRSRGRGLFRPAARVRRYDDLDAGAGRRTARARRSRRAAEFPRRVGQPRLLRRDAPASPRWASLHALRPRRRPRRRRGERDVRPRPVPRRAGRRTARAARARRWRRRTLVGGDRRGRGHPVTRDSCSPGSRRKRSPPRIRPGRPTWSAPTPSSACGPPGIRPP